MELGPGTGGTTKALLRSLSADAKLISIEIVPEFVEELRQIDDPRLIVCHGDAADLLRILSESESRTLTWLFPEYHFRRCGRVSRRLLSPTFIAHSLPEDTDEDQAVLGNSAVQDV